jgi:hypothetical protein
MFRKMGNLIAKVGTFLKTPIARFANATPKGILIFGIGVAAYKIVCIAERAIEAKMAEKGYEKGPLVRMMDKFLSGEFFTVEPEPG